MRVVGFEPTNS